MAEEVTAPLPGKILSIKVKLGDQVKEADVLLILEAMKMENEILAPKAGVIKEIKVAADQSVDVGAPMVTIE
jgi:biotin carboxyl carrier protein